MADPAAALLAVALPVAVGLLAVVAAAFGGALDARAAGVPVRFGLAAPLSEGARLLRQQRRTLAGADPLLWRLGGAGLLVAAALQVVVVPVGGVVAADLPAGVVWFNAVDVLLWACWWLLGWGANSAWPLIGGYRFLAQALSYELPLMFALVGPAIAARSLRLSDVVAAQRDLWFAAEMPVAFLVFLAAVAAFAARAPFATAAGQDVASGVLAELSGPDRLLVLAGRTALPVAGSAVGAALFLGGGAGPLLPPCAWLLVKTAALTAVLVVAGRALPAIRAERLAEVSWLIVTPLVLVQLVIVAVLAAAGRT